MKKDTLQQFWMCLGNISRFTFESSCGPGSQTGWTGSATGEVDIRRFGDTIEFQERCVFHLNTGETMELKNGYRWTLLSDGVKLSHIRRKEPVNLVTLIPTGKATLGPENSHLCGQDCYVLNIEIRDGGFDAVWRITGPKKDERIFYRYR